MKHLSNAIGMAKALAPKIIASPLQAPTIIRRHLSSRVIAALSDLFFDPSDAGDGAAAAPAMSGPAASPYMNMEKVAPGYMNMTKVAPGYMNMTKVAPGYLQMNKVAPGYLQMNKVAPLARAAAVQAAVSPLGVVPATLAIPAVPAMPALNGIEMIPLSDATRNHDQSVNVKYVTDPARRLSRYEATLAGTMMRRGQALDTKAVKDAYSAKNKPYPISAAGLGRNQAESNKFMNEAILWGRESLIWVCVTEAGRADPVFYTGVCRGGLFHHSSFTAGGDVIGAGEWIVQKGHLLKISANSGHYRPPYEFFRRAVTFMSKSWQADTTVFLWNTKTSTYEDVPVRKFVATPNGGGVWKTHPDGR